MSDERPIETPSALALGALALVILLAAGFWRDEHTTVVCAVFASGLAYLSQMGAAVRASRPEESWARPLHRWSLVAAAVLWFIGAMWLL